MVFHGKVVPVPGIEIVALHDPIELVDDHACPVCGDAEEEAHDIVDTFLVRRPELVDLVLIGYDLSIGLNDIPKLTSVVD